MAEADLAQVEPVGQNAIPYRLDAGWFSPLPRGRRLGSGSAGILGDVRLPTIETRRLGSPDNSYPGRIVLWQ